MSSIVERNPGLALDLAWVNSVSVNLPAVERRAEQLGARRTVKKQWQAAWLLRAVSCIDLTTLSGDDTSVNVDRLCFKAASPVRADLLKALDMHDVGLTTGAVCVYPARVPDAVAAGFPSGQYPLSTRLTEVSDAVAAGAKEIDIVINREAALKGDWETVFEEVKAMRKACGEAHMKTILATGELGSLTNVYRASIVCMMAGADFIKTSTGKEGVNAILPVGIVMCRAIREYYQKTGYKVGFKPAGGIRVSKDAILWLILMKEELGVEWTKPHLFRIGASGLLTDIERQLYHHVTGRYAANHDFAMS